MVVLGRHYAFRRVVAVLADQFVDLRADAREEMDRAVGRTIDWAASDHDVG